MTIFAIVKNGKFLFEDNLAILAIAKEFEGKEISVSIEKKSPWKSYLQVKYWWGVVIPLVRNGYRDIGYDLTKEGTHSILMEAFSRHEITDQRTGDIRGSYTLGMSKMKKSQMIELIDRVRQFSSETLHTFIPEPDREWRLKKAA